MRKLIHTFEENTKLCGQKRRLFLILSIWSLLYSAVSYAFMKAIAGVESMFVMYALLYVLVMAYTLIDNQIICLFMTLKHGDKRHSLKDGWLTQLGFKSILYLLVIALSYGTFYVAMQNTGGMYESLYLLFSMIAIWMVLLYLPLNAMSVFMIYRGERNVGKVFCDVLKLIVKRYRSVFYSFLPILLLSVLYHSVMSVCFQVSSAFVPSSTMLSLISDASPFQYFYIYLRYVFENTNLFMPLVVSLIYGFVFSFVMVYFYMLMACIVDEDITY